MSYDYEIITNQSDSLSRDKFGHKFTTPLPRAQFSFLNSFPGLPCLELVSLWSKTPVRAKVLGYEE